ncbi:hypothetical protein DPMN_189501 [Dreissena polymorpha]|uniref:Mab-21-like HhH/H2TH-like domain-containing protein n=1 Tax=Dreissena polymorpha TaxID=45954 RepID=A0A9D4DVM5_DREPO|nr:hypothetical protein DPMN_189501 [Dreissena polymorpha]
MTRLGYGEEIRRWRVEKYKEYDRLSNVKPVGNLTQISAESKKEGLSCIGESDFDFLCFVNGVLCVEADINLNTIPDGIDLFRMDTRVYPGHCMLLQERQRQNCLQPIRNALCDNGYGDILLSSCLWVDGWSTYLPPLPGEARHERAGPSTPSTYGGMFEHDFVVGLRCHCPSILQKWAARPRHWPPQRIVQKVVSLGAYVTPVGCKGSENYHMEWRICFNTGEAELVNDLNDTQAKVYVLLKMILKEIIKPDNKEITSFVLKNIILWQAENNPQTKFHARSLFYWLHDGLRELRTAIEKKQLRYYMIPERNLMAACGLTDALQSKWVADITVMMEEGPRVILRLEKVRKAIIASPEPLLWLSKKMMELEMLQLEFFNRDWQCKNENREWRSDFIIQAIKRRMEEIMTEVVINMIQVGSSSFSDLVVRIIHCILCFIDYLTRRP